MPKDTDFRESSFIPVFIIVAVVAAIAAMFGFAIWASTEVKSHSWYPPSCCSGLDCSPADEAVRDVPGGLEVEGYGFFRSDDPRVHNSMDGEAHLCVSKTTNKVLCIFRRPGLF